MSVEGVWNVEILGPYGWEQVATAFLWNGRYLAASADHYSIGSYEEGDGILKLEARMTQHGKTRTLFGSTQENVDMKMEGRIEQADKIVGTAKPPEAGGFDLHVRLTRLGGLD